MQIQINNLRHINNFCLHLPLQESRDNFIFDVIFVLMADNRAEIGKVKSKELTEEQIKGLLRVKLVRSFNRKRDLGGLELYDKRLRKPYHFSPDTEHQALVKIKLSKTKYYFHVPTDHTINNSKRFIRVASLTKDEFLHEWC